MEEIFDQISMDVGAIDASSDDSGEATEGTDTNTTITAQEAPSSTSRQATPETVQIDGEEATSDDSTEEDDLELISPDEEIFRIAADQIRTADENRRSEMYEWTEGAMARHEQVDVEYDERFASSSRSESDFLRAFGIADRSGAVLNVDDSMNPSTAEIETLQSDIHSDYYEYTDRQQRKEIIGMYKFAKRSIRTKLIISGIFALFLLLIENITLFSSNPTGIFNVVQHPYLHFFVDLGLLALCALCAYEQIYHGIKSIISKEYIPEAITVFSLGAAIIYSIFTIIFVPFNVVPQLYNFPTAIVCVLSIAFSYINVAREKYSFSIVSSKDTKFVLSKATDDDSEAEIEAFSTMSKDFVGELIRVEKAEFVKRYFARTNKSANTAKIMYPYYILAVCVPLIVAIIALFRGSDFMSTMTSWYAGVMMVMPVGVLFMYSVPFFVGNKHLYEEETSIIGEQTIYEFSGSKAVSVNDTTAFPPYNVKLQNFNVYNDYKIEKVLYYAANGFSIVGGPLSDVFEIATKDAFTKSKRARFVCSGRSYLCVKVDNDTIIFADRYGITSQGIEISNERDDAGEDVSVMYMACNGKLCARMYIKYTMDEDFAQTVRNLNKCGVSVGIRTFDPNINNELLKRQMAFKNTDLRVIRLSKSDEIPTVMDKADSGIVSKGHSRSLIKAIPICKGIAKIRKVGTIVNIIASIIGVALLSMSVFGMIPLLSSLLIVGYYVVWITIMLIISSVMLLQ